MRERIRRRRCPGELRGCTRAAGGVVDTHDHAAEFRALLDIHVGTTFATCRAAAPPRMVARGRGGAIVNTSSFAFLGDYGGTGYPAGKGAVNGLTMAIAAELAGHGVRANVVCPGAKTRLSSGSDFEEQIESLRQRGILDDVSAHGALDAASPEYVAPVYAYLVSDLASKITGQMFIASGGFVGGRFDKPAPRVHQLPGSSRLAAVDNQRNRDDVGLTYAVRSYISTLPTRIGVKLR